MNDFEKGLLLGVLIGEGHFGGDGVQPHVTLRMHVKHKTLFEYLSKLVPGSRLYGPYNHSGRQYYQLMIRGKPLKEFLIPLLESVPFEAIDEACFKRYTEMKQSYGL